MDAASIPANLPMVDAAFRSLGGDGKNDLQQDVICA